MRIISKVQKISIWNEYTIEVSCDDFVMKGEATSGPDAEALRIRWEKIIEDKYIKN